MEGRSAAGCESAREGVTGEGVGGGEDEKDCRVWGMEGMEGKEEGGEGEEEGGVGDQE